MPYFWQRYLTVPYKILQFLIFFVKSEPCAKCDAPKCHNPNSDFKIWEMNVNLVLITDIEINARHNLLLQTIGVLQMEIEAYQTVSLFFILIPVIILLSILQLGFFTLYNGRFHPMSTILDAATTSDKEDGEYVMCKYLQSIIF